MASREVHVTSTGAPFAQSIAAGPHRLIADEPVDVGGGEAGPNPYDLLLGALGSCTSMTLGVYARRKQWPLERVDVTLAHTRDYGADSRDCEGRPVRVERIDRRITLVGPLSDEQRARLLEIAEKCPVHRTLTARIDIHTELAPAAPAAEHT